MKLNSLFFSMAIAVGFIACSDETTVYEDSNSNLVLESDQETLDNSVIFDNSGVLDIAEKDFLSGKYSKTGDELAGDHPLTLVAQIKSPSSTLTASHVFLEGNYVYVTYNTIGDVYYGAIDIVNISNPNKPYLTSRLRYTNADLNSVKYENGYVYVVGGVDAEKSVRATSNSFIAKIAVSNGVFNLRAGITYGFQNGYNSTDIKLTPTTILVSSGKDGSLTVYNKNSIEIIKEISFPDLRSLTVRNNKIAVLDASTGVSILDENFNSIKDIAINSDFGEFSKRTLEFYGDKIIVSEGSNGAGVYDSNSGSLLQYLPIIDKTTTHPDNYLADRETNAVVVNEDIVLMANGSAGLCLSQDKDNTLETYGVIDLPGSINFVESKGDYIFAASGTAGLQIIKINRQKESLASKCVGLQRYRGSSKLVVNAGEQKQYTGAKRFRSITVNGELLLCGSWTVKSSTVVKSNGLFEMRGNYTLARNNRRKNLIIEEGATFRAEGNVSIYGDIILKDNATIEFLGEGSNISVYGKVTKSSTAKVLGTFNDVKNKF